MFCHSYERHYKGLLDHMIRNDLALKGNFDGVQLLIFPSNQLPENSQRKELFHMFVKQSNIVSNLWKDTCGIGVCALISVSWTAEIISCAILECLGEKIV